MKPMLSLQTLPDRDQFHGAIGRGGDAWFRACLRITNDASLAQDAVQDALLNAWRKRDQFRGGAKLESWIHRIAVNSAIAVVRGQKRQPLALTTEIAEDSASGPDRELDLDDLNSELNKALSELSELERVCFVLKHLEDWRLSEIASQLNTGVGSVKQALFRAVKKLRQQLTSLREKP